MCAPWLLIYTGQWWAANNQMPATSDEASLSEIWCAGHYYMVGGQGILGVAPTPDMPRRVLMNQRWTMWWDLLPSFNALQKPSKVGLRSKSAELSGWTGRFLQLWLGMPVLIYFLKYASGHSRTVYCKFSTRNCLCKYCNSLIQVQAGGSGSTGAERILDLQPTTLHQRLPVFLGSPEDISELEGYGDVQQVGTKKYTV